MVRVDLEGSLYEKRKIGRRVYRAYFVLFADGVMLKDVRESGEEMRVASVSFERSLIIFGKSGPSGLEGCVPEGGSWLLVRLAPSSEERAVTLNLVLPGEKVSLTVKGGIDISFVKFCPSCDYRSLLKLQTRKLKT
ncbi:MAG: hypothetical protein QW650_07655 [Thermofilum sp.]